MTARKMIISTLDSGAADRRPSDQAQEKPLDGPQPPDGMPPKDTVPVEEPQEKADKRRSTLWWPHWGHSIPSSEPKTSSSNR